MSADPGLMATLFPEDDFSLIAVVLGMPLLGAAVNGIWGKRLGKEAVRMMALTAVGVSFLAAVVTFLDLGRAVAASEHVEDGKRVLEHVRLSWTAWEWMHTNGGRSASGIPIALKFSVDALSSVMMLVITGIGFLIHLYASSYMEKDNGYARFFCYLNLFIFAMLTLVLADNLPVLFIGWEGVGLCSYLLIGFWYEKMPNATAGKKAFIANRIGDFGLICAMFLLAHYTGALDWKGIETGASSLIDTPADGRIHLWPIGGGTYQGIFQFLQPKSAFTVSAATAVSLMLLLGCTGKSAQIPLYVWLPDAMAGPTPVSALIHAATMVTAGIYLICRLSFVFVLSPFAMTVTAVIGASTALMAATIALVQNDIKKVLAYSTVSQLGFMFLGVGVGAFTAGFFHVFTHAFFKACLFLGAGSVIHAMHVRIHDDDKSQDIRNMGGLRRYMPYTYWTFAASTAAIIGLPLLSGFFSKDEILFRAYTNAETHPMAARLKQMHNEPFLPPTWLGPTLYWMGVAAATLTAFYMCRVFFMTFHGRFRGWEIGRPSLLAKIKSEHHHEQEHGDDEEHHHDEEDLKVPGYAPHESPWQMTVPLIVLATGAVFAGVFNMGPVGVTPLDHWLEPVFESALKGSIAPRAGAEHLEWPLMGGGFFAFAIGSFLAYRMYVMDKGKAEESLQGMLKRIVPAVPGVLVLVVGGVLIRSFGISGSGFAYFGDVLVVAGGSMAYFYREIGLDSLYAMTILDGTDALADTSASFDQWVVDGVLAKLTAFLVSVLGTILRAMHNGVVHVYALAMVVGVAAMGWFFVAPHADVLVVAKGGDVTITSGSGAGYLDYTYSWDQCEPDKKQWTDLFSKATSAQQRQQQQDTLTVSHMSCEAPGDKWNAVGKPGFSSQNEVTLHLDPDADDAVEVTRPVRMRSRNAFSQTFGDWTATKVIQAPRQAKLKMLEVGQN